MDRSEIRTGAVLAIVLASYTMIALDISIVITALCSPVRMCMHQRLDRTRAVRRRCARYRVNPSASNDLDETSSLLHIANLRRKIEPVDGERLIHTDYGVGYRLADVHPEGTRRRRPAEEVIDREFVRGRVSALPDLRPAGWPRPARRRVLDTPTVVWHDSASELGSRR